MEREELGCFYYMGMADQQGDPRTGLGVGQSHRLVIGAGEDEVAQVRRLEQQQEADDVDAADPVTMADKALETVAGDEIPYFHGLISRN